MERLQVHDDDTFLRAVHAADVLKQSTGRACLVVQKRLPPGIDATFQGSAATRAFLEQYAGIRVQAAA